MYCSEALFERIKVLEGHQHEERPLLHGMRCAAVMIPILKKQGFPILYTLRSRHLRHHAGQFSFPGGVVEEGETPWQAALREAHEEIGLEAAAVTRLGRISDAYSPRGYHIECFVALVDAFEPTLNEEEVERVIEVDMHQLFDSSRHAEKPWGPNPERLVHYFEFDEGLVWGVTGKITANLREALQ